MYVLLVLQRFLIFGSNQEFAYLGKRGCEPCPSHTSTGGLKATLSEVLGEAGNILPDENLGPW